MHTARLLPFLVLMALPLAAAPVRELQVRVNGVVCAFCMHGLEELVARQPAVEAMRADMDNSILVVTVRPGSSITHEQMRSWVYDSGYEVASILDSERTTPEVATALAERLGAPLPAAPTSALLGADGDGRPWARVTVAAKDTAAWAAWLEDRPSIMPPAPDAWREMDAPLRQTVVRDRPGYVAAEGRVIYVSL